MRHRSVPAPRRFPTGGHPKDHASSFAPHPAAPTATLNFQIGRVTGYAPAEQKRFTQSLESNLAGLARSHAAEHDWTNVAGLRVKRLDAAGLPAGASPEETARHIAKQIFAKLIQQSGGKPHA